MADLEKVSKAQLQSALTETGGQLQRRLPKEELKALGVMLEKTARRYPNQDMQMTMGEYLTDFEQLAVKHSLVKVEKALSALRIDPDQDFFPTPSEVAHEIRQQWLKSLPSDLYARG